MEPPIQDRLVVFAGDVAVIVSGKNTQILEKSTNNTLRKIASWMEDKGLALAAHKTEAVVMTTKRGYEQPSFVLNGVTLNPKEKLKYLGMELSTRLGYRDHLNSSNQGQRDCRITCEDSSKRGGIKSTNEKTLGNGHE